MEETTSTLHARIKNCKHWSKHATKQIKLLQRKGQYTDDIDLVLRSLENLFKRMNREVFSRSCMRRILFKRVSPKMIERANDICGDTKYSGLVYYGYEIKKALWYYQSKRIKEENPERFEYYESVINDIRDDINTVVEIRFLLNEYGKRYGTYNHILTDREVNWVHIITGFIGGLVTGVVVPVVLRIF